MTSSLTCKIIRQALENNDAVLTAGICAYSGRGMRGRECTGVEVEDLSDLVVLGAAIARELGDTADGDYDTAMDAIEDTIRVGLRPIVESAYRNFVAYWPGVPFTD